MLNSSGSLSLSLYRRSPNLCGTLLDSLVLFERRSPEMDAVFQYSTHQCRVEEEENLFRHAGHTLFNVPQSTVALLGQKGTLLAHGQLVVHQGI